MRREEGHRTRMPVEKPTAGRRSGPRAAESERESSGSAGTVVGEKGAVRFRPVRKPVVSPAPGTLAGGNGTASRAVGLPSSAELASAQKLLDATYVFEEHEDASEGGAASGGSASGEGAMSDLAESAKEDAAAVAGSVQGGEGDLEEAEASRPRHVAFRAAAFACALVLAAMMASALYACLGFQGLSEDSDGGMSGSSSAGVGAWLDGSLQNQVETYLSDNLYGHDEFAAAAETLDALAGQQADSYGQDQPASGQRQEGQEG